MEYLKDILIYKKHHKPEVMERRKGNRRSLLSGLESGRVNIIAEIKAASPSRGIISKKLDKGEAARRYASHPRLIKGISVLTEPLYFKGCASDIGDVKKSCRLPVLRKDFIIYPEQVEQSACIASDCILLIAGLMGSKKLKSLMRLADALGLEVLVEAHDKKELNKAIEAGARLVGINNRNLKTLEVNRENAASLIKQAGQKEGVTFVSESGIESIDDILRLYDMGINNFLIGTYFMRAKNPGYTLECLENVLISKGLV